MGSWLRANRAEWGIASVCSGSESPFIAWQALSSALESLYGTTLQVHHSFAAESHPQKRRFIRTMIPGAIIFQDAFDLPRGRGRIDDNTIAGVPSDFRVLIAGFPCTSASSLNRHASSVESRTCIAAKSHATGSVFGAICSLLEAHSHHIDFVVFENVVNLACVPSRGKHKHSNLDEAVNALQKFGFRCCVFRLEPSDWGVPVSRPRLWFVGVNERLHQGTRPPLGPFLQATMDKFVGVPMSDLADFLLPEDSDIVRRHAEQVGERRSNESEMRRPAKWRALHQQLFARSPFLKGAEPGKLNAGLMELFPGLRVLTQRQIETLGIVGVTDFPTLDHHTVELKHNANRTRLSQRGFASCILPGGQQYLTHRCRLMMPVESLRLQGIYVERSVSSSFSPSLLQSLAGNAFEVNCCMATLLATFVWLSQHVPRKSVSEDGASASSLPLARPLADLGDDSESDESGDSCILGGPTRRRRLC